MPQPPNPYDTSYWKELLPIGTFILGFLSSRFTMTKKEKKDYKNTLQENANKYSKELDDAFNNFMASLQKYIQCDTPTLENFQDISISGESYFSAMKRLSSAILERNIPKRSIDHDFCQRIKEFVEKNCELYYEALSAIAQKIGVQYNGAFRRENYESIFLVYETYCNK